MKIVVVGGGTAGFVSALILKKSFPHFQVDVLRSKKLEQLVWAKEVPNIGLRLWTM